jgi:hypothetical protein
MKEVTELLSAIDAGEKQAADDLLPLIQGELRRLLKEKLAAADPLDAAALNREAYARLVDKGNKPSWKSRSHFLLAATEALRRILIESARGKRGPNDLLEIDRALEKLAKTESRVVQLVRLRFFGGFTLEQAAQVLGVTARAAESYWEYGQAWLHVEIEQGADERRG